MGAAKLAVASGLLLLLVTGYQAMICECRAQQWARHGAEPPCPSAPCPSAPSRPALLSPSEPSRACPPNPSPRPADREDLRLTGKEFVGLPLPLLAQLLVAAAVCLAGGLQASGEFKPVALGDNQR